MLQSVITIFDDFSRRNIARFNKKYYLESLLGMIFLTILCLIELYLLKTIKGSLYEKQPLQDKVSLCKSSYFNDKCLFMSANVDFMQIIKFA
ncbi:hypothetical protein BIY22_10405 [Vibrio panuliri]|uniref:Uncharacterized protein n=1 Tax=Vibrio panuliri TaxID=1381081 RepID=A0A1Q9HC62_9VIBR|nr:hypothetical protein BIY22_10405 [Vibrio panuliri]